MKPAGLITIAAAKAILQSHAPHLGTEILPLSFALGRVTAQDVYACYHHPPFNRSKRDGYACRLKDLGKPLKIIGTIPAGKAVNGKLKSGQCFKIMTGAVVPSEADCVVEVERVNVDCQGCIFCASKPKDKNIAYAGEDMQKKSLLLARGVVLSPAHLALLASDGHAQIKVNKVPRVGIIVTGSELIMPGQAKQNIAQIFDSSSYGLSAQLRQAGIDARFYGIAFDNKLALGAVVKKAKGENDLLFVCGGVSMGDYDFVPQVFEESGFEKVFHKVNIEPGKPLLFARSKTCLCFGVPGNPVSTLVGFEIFFKDFIWAIQGINNKTVLVHPRLTNKLTRIDCKRQGFYPGLLKGNFCQGLAYHGSGHLQALAKANCLIEFPQGQATLNKGAQVNVRPI